MKSNYDIYPKSLVAQNMVFQNMSHHYRKIYSAKPRIDTRRQCSYKPMKLSSSGELKRNKSSSRLENKPTNSLDTADQKRMTYRQCCAEKNNSYVKYTCDDVPLYHPRILKTNVESKVKNLQVYHPPRRRLPMSVAKQQIETQFTPEPENEIDNEDVEERWIETINPSSVEDNKTHLSKPCSSDSAYTEEGEAGWSGSGGESRGVTPIEVNTLSSTPVLEWTSSQRSYRSDDVLYVRFLREITEEVLRKGVFTNRALKQIFQDHVKANKYNLEIVRMQEEIEKLRIELAIPKEDYLNDIDFGLGNATRIEPRTNSSENDNFSDNELLDALNQLDISNELKADVANSLGLRSNCTPVDISSQSSLVSVERKSIDRKDLHIHLPSSDEESNEYDVCSEFSESSHNSPNVDTL